MTRTRLLALLVPAALACSATPALADGESITMTQTDASAVAGHATNFTAAGALNPADTMFGFDIYVFLKNPDADPTCAADFDSESATAMHSGGNESWVSPAGGFQVGAGPSFNAPFKITFTGSGKYLLCGYVQGDFSTFAHGELRGVVASGGVTPAPTPTPGPVVPAPPALPVASRAPWITRKGHVLTCHAGTWSNAPTRIGYRWSLAGSGKRLGTSSRLTVRRSLKGRMVACRVTAQNAAGAATLTTRSIRAH